MSSIASKLATKSMWPMADRALRMVVGVAVTALVARHLGPEGYGALAFALAWTNFVGGISWLGLGDAVVRDLVRTPQDRHRILATVAVLRTVGSIAAGLLAVGLFPVFYAEQPHAVAVLVWLIAASVPFQEIAGVPLLWAQSEADTRTIVLVRLIPYLIAQIMRIGLVFGSAALVWFGALAPIEGVLCSAASWTIYLLRDGRGAVLRFDGALARSLMRDALPILVSAVLATLALRLDQMMLAKLANLEEVGYYAAATRFSEIWWSVPTVLMQIAGPLVLFGERDAMRRDHRLGGLYAMLIAAACAATCATLLVAPWGLPLLLGARFEGAVPVLMVHVFTAILVFADAPTLPELIRRGLQRILLWKGLTTLAINAVLNYLLIPQYGAIGASIATVAGYLASAIMVPVVFAQTRDLTRMQLRAPLWLWRYATRR